MFYCFFLDASVSYIFVKNGDDAVAIMGLVVKAKLCTIGFSPCSEDCNEFCNIKIPGSTGACNKEECVCMYECPPEPRRCNDGGGRCTAQCSDDCCTRNCQAKHPTAEAVVGICDDSLGPANVLCQCQYNCS